MVQAAGGVEEDHVARSANVQNKGKQVWVNKKLCYTSQKFLSKTQATKKKKRNTHILIRSVSWE